MFDICLVLSCIHLYNHSRFCLNHYPVLLYNIEIFLVNLTFSVKLMLFNERVHIHEKWTSMLDQPYPKPNLTDFTITLGHCLHVSSLPPHSLRVSKSYWQPIKYFLYCRV